MVGCSWGKISAAELVWPWSRQFTSNVQWLWSLVKIRQLKVAKFRMMKQLEFQKACQAFICSWLNVYLIIWNKITCCFPNIVSSELPQDSIRYNSKSTKSSMIYMMVLMKWSDLLLFLSWVTFMQLKITFKSK